MNSRPSPQSFDSRPEAETAAERAIKLASCFKDAERSAHQDYEQRLGDIIAMYPPYHEKTPAKKRVSFDAKEPGHLHTLTREVNDFFDAHTGITKNRCFEVTELSVSLGTSTPGKQRYIAAAILVLRGQLDKVKLSDVLYKDAAIAICIPEIREELNQALKQSFGGKHIASLRYSDASRGIDFAKGLVIHDKPRFQKTLKTLSQADIDKAALYVSNQQAIIDGQPVRKRNIKTGKLTHDRSRRNYTSTGQLCLHITKKQQNTLISETDYKADIRERAATILRERAERKENRRRLHAQEQAVQPLPSLAPTADKPKAGPRPEKTEAKIIRIPGPAQSDSAKPTMQKKPATVIKLQPQPKQTPVTPTQKKEPETKASQAQVIPAPDIQPSPNNRRFERPSRLGAITLAAGRAAMFSAIAIGSFAASGAALAFTPAGMEQIIPYPQLCMAIAGTPLGKVGTVFACLGGCAYGLFQLHNDSLRYVNAPYMRVKNALQQAETKRDTATHDLITDIDKKVIPSEFPQDLTQISEISRLVTAMRTQWDEGITRQQIKETYRHLSAGHLNWLIESGAIVMQQGETGEDKARFELNPVLWGRFNPNHTANTDNSKAVNMMIRALKVDACLANPHIYPDLDQAMRTVIEARKKSEKTGETPHFYNTEQMADEILSSPFHPDSLAVLRQNRAITDDTMRLSKKRQPKIIKNRLQHARRNPKWSGMWFMHPQVG